MLLPHSHKQTVHEPIRPRPKGAQYEILQCYLDSAQLQCEHQPPVGSAGPYVSHNAPPVLLGGATPHYTVCHMHHIQYDTGGEHLLDSETSVTHPVHQYQLSR